MSGVCHEIHDPRDYFMIAVQPYIEALPLAASEVCKRMDQSRKPLGDETFDHFSQLLTAKLFRWWDLPLLRQSPESAKRVFS
jgi:hypothetical protein